MGLNHGWRGPNIVRDGLVLYLDAGSPNSYPGSGTTWKDISKYYQNNGTLTNGPTFSSANGGSIVFDGVNDYVRVANSTSIKPPTITLSSWVKYSVLGSYSKTFSLDYRANGTWTPPYTSYELSLYSTSKKPYINLTIGGTAKSLIANTILTTGSWYNIVATYDNNIILCYINGIQDVNTVSATGSIDYGTSIDLAIGQDSPYNSIGEWLNGNLGNIQIYNRALSASEVLQNYNALKSRFGL